MLRSSLVLPQPPSATQATSLAPRVCVHRARVVAMAAVTAAAAAAAAAADDDAGGATTGGARRGVRACAVGRGCGVVAGGASRRSAHGPRDESVYSGVYWPVLQLGEAHKKDHFRKKECSEDPFGGWGVRPPTELRIYTSQRLCGFPAESVGTYTKAVQYV